MRRSAFCGALIVLVCAALGGCGPVDAPVQSERRPYDLDIVDTVKQAGSDGKAERFRREVLADAAKLASESFTAEVIAQRLSELALDPARLDVVERTNRPSQRGRQSQNREWLRD